MQLDPAQARFDELLRRLESQESLIKALQATQVPLNAEKPETDCAQKPQNHSDDQKTMLRGMEMVKGLAKAGAEAGTIDRMHLGNTKSTHDPRSAPTWNGDCEFDVFSN